MPLGEGPIVTVPWPIGVVAMLRHSACVWPQIPQPCPEKPLI